MEGEQGFNKEALAEKITDMPADRCTTDVVTTTDEFALIPQEAMDKMKVSEVKEDLKKCGTKGKRKHLN
eukprot:15244779-Ditylum_brightwellii.AAC.1